jgi:CBS domain containing-hemolysin-like protein
VITDFFGAIPSLNIPSLTGVQIALLSSMAPLLAALAFFSFIETTYFALTPAERLGLRRKHPKGAATIDNLLARPRVLLVGTMLGSLLASTAYLVVSSVLVASSDSIALSIAIAALSLFGMVLSAEVLPKLVGNADRARSAQLAVVPTIVFCAFIRPIAETIDSYILAPFGRLTQAAQGTSVVDAAELAALLAQSADEGAIDLREREALEGVMRLQRLRVRDVMTPRVDMVFVYHDASDEELVATAARARLTRLPVVGRDADDVQGILDLARYILQAGAVSRNECTDPVRFVPELASLEQLLEHFRRTASKLAIAVDEYGGTAGIVALEDCVEEIVGDIVGLGERVVDAPLEVAAGVWRVSGEMGIARWSEHFGARVISPRASTVAGLVMQRLARLARVGDAVDIANIHVEVEAMHGARVTSVLVSLIGVGRSS